jgi:uncharacterized membrane protein YdjX (TVP38/TMEM64 family)
LRFLQARAWRKLAKRSADGVLFTLTGSSYGPRWGKAVNLLTIFVLAVGLPMLVGALGGGERLRELVEQSGPLAPLAYVAAKAAVTIVAPLSGVPLKAASGTLFGFGGGFAYSVLGDVIGGCVCFLAARHLGRGFLEWLMWDGHTSQVHSIVGRGVGGWRELLFCRVTFSAVYNLLSCAAGATKLPFWQYLSVTTFGGIIHTGFLVTLGASAALSWNERLGAYAAIAGLALLALLGGRHLRRILEGGREPEQRRPGARRERSGSEPPRAEKTSTVRRFAES